MRSYDTNVVIHVAEELNDDQIYGIQQELAGVSGLVSACVHERTRHLWIIDYDPRQVRSGQLLQHIRDNGLHAELIGGV